MSDPSPYLLSDEHIQAFIKHGYLVLPPLNHRDHPGHTFHQKILEDAQALFAQSEVQRGAILSPKSLELLRNPGNNILPLIPRLLDIVEHPVVQGTVSSLLGPQPLLHAFRTVHRSVGEAFDDDSGLPPLSPSAHSLPWKQASYFGYQDVTRTPDLEWVRLLYFPQDTPLQLGPIEVLPGSQYVSLMLHRSQKGWVGSPQEDHKEDHRLGHRRSDRAPSAEFSDPLCFPCAAGTCLLLHYDLWTRLRPNLSRGSAMYSFEFVFCRTVWPSASQGLPWASVQPTWEPSFNVEARLGPILQDLRDGIVAQLGGERGQAAASVFLSLTVDSLVSMSRSVAEAPHASSSKQLQAIIRQLLQNMRAVRRDTLINSTAEELTSFCETFESVLGPAFFRIYNDVYLRSLAFVERAPLWKTIWYNLVGGVPSAVSPADVDLDSLVAVLTAPLDQRKHTVANRMAAAYSLLQVGPVDGVGLLIGTFRELYPINFAAMYALASARGQAAELVANRLTVLFGSPEYDSLLWQIVFVLGRIGVASSLEFLADLAQDRDQWVRREVADAMCRLLAIDDVKEDKRWVSTIGTLMADSVDLVRMTAFLGVLRLPLEKAKFFINELETGLSDKNRYVVGYAIETLCRVIAAECRFPGACGSLFRLLTMSRLCMLTNNRRKF